MKNTIYKKQNTPPPPQSYLGRRLFSAGKQKASCLLKPLLYLIPGGLLSFSSLIYAVEQGEYQHYVGFGISGALFSDSLQEIRFESRDISTFNDDVTESGYLFVWDRFNSDNREALSLMFLSVNHDGSTSLDIEWEENGEQFFDVVTFSDKRTFSGPSLVYKYFTESGFYVGGGGALLSMSGEISMRNEEPSFFFQDQNADISSDSFLAPTLVLGYRGLVSELANSHLYISVDWIRTLSVDVRYEHPSLSFYDPVLTDEGQVMYDTDVTPNSFSADTDISMIAVSFGWAW